MNGKLLPSPTMRASLNAKPCKAWMAAIAILLCAMASTLAAPTMQIIYPVNGASVEGVVNLRVFAYEGAVITQPNINLIDSVKFFRKADTTTKIVMTRIASTGEWSGVWNAASLTAGPDTLFFRAVNNTGLTKTDSSIIVTIVNGGAVSGPTVDVTSPAPGSVISGTQAIAFTSTAGSGSISAREISVDGAAYVATSAAGSHSLNTVPLTEGSHTVRLRITNSNGSATESRIITYFVVNSPTVAWTLPTGGSTVTGKLILNFSSTPMGQASIASDSLLIDGKVVAALKTPNGPDTVNVDNLQDGTHTFEIKATDSNGKTALSNQVALLIANSPTVTWTSPAGGAVIGGRLIVNYTAAAVAPATLASESLWVDGRNFSVLKSSGPDSLDINGLAEGTHTFQIKATDSNGKTGLSLQTALVVHNGPWATVLTPIGGAQVSGKVAFTYSDSAAALATIASDSLLIDGKVAQALSLSGKDTLNSTTLSDGAHTFQIKTTDSRGRTGYSMMITLQVGNSPVALIDSALADSTVSGTLVIKFKVTAVLPAVVTARQIAIDGGAFVAANGTVTDTLDTRKLSEGAHTAQIRGLDDKGKEGFSRIVKFNVHNAPTVTIKAPAVDAYVRGTVRVSFAAKAVAPDTIKSTQISLGGGDWIATTTDSTYSLDTRNFKDGDLRIQVRAIDGNGKSAITLAREMVVDNSAPKISYPSVAYPENAPSARKGVNVLVTVQGLDLGAGMATDSAMTLGIGDLGLKGILLLDDGQNGDKVKGDNVFSAMISIDTALNGEVPYTIRARDALGNDSTVSGTLLFDNTPPTLSFALEPTPGNVPGALTGEVYVSRILMQGEFSDSGSGMKSLDVTVRNDSGDHVNNSPDAIPLVDGTFRRIIELIPGKNSINLNGMDKAGNARTVSATVTYVVPKETKIVDGAGGSVFGADGSGVSIPAGTLGQAKEVTVKVVDDQQEPKPLDQKIKLLGVPHEFGPDGTVFPSPVTVTLTYTDADLDRNQDGVPDFDENKLTIVFWNGKTWVKAGDAAINHKAHTISVPVNHFTLYDIAEDQSAAPTSLVTYWDRNPVPGNAEFIYKVPSSGKISLHILDMAGDVVKTLIQPGTAVTESGSVRWDGSNVRGNFAGAGLYVYVFKYASDDGKTDKLIRKPVGLVGK